jgi:ribosome-binding factor A
MSVDRIKRVNELLHREIGEALYHVLRDDELDLSSVMVSHVVTHRDLRQARVLVSVRGTAAEQARALGVLRRRRGAIQAAVMRRVVLKYTPRLNFELDQSVHQGDRVLEILSELGPAGAPDGSSEEEAP